MWPRAFRSQGIKSGSVGKDIWLGFRDVVVLKEVCHWDWALRVQRLAPFLVYALPSAFSLSCEFSASYFS